MKINMYKGIIFPLVAALAIAGCTKKKEKSTANKGASQVSSFKEVVIARQSDPRTLDPQAQFDQASGEVVAAVYDTLLQYHYLKRPYAMEPSLLSKMPEADKTGTLYTFELKQGIFFHDNACFPGSKGRELIADDVLYTIKRFADININVNSYFMLAGHIQGLDEFREQTKKLGKDKVDHMKMQVSGLKKLGKYRFQVKLNAATPLFLYAFASSATSIVPHEAVTHYGDKFAKNPVGTGAFTMSDYKKKRTFIFKKNPKYFGTYPTEGAPGDAENGLLADAGKQLPLVDQIKILFIPEPQPGMLKFLKGETSFIGLDKDNFLKMGQKNADGTFSLKGKYAEAFQIYYEPTLSNGYISVNLKDKLLGQNKYLRQAIATAIDVNEYIKILRNDRAWKLNTIVPHTIAGSERDIGKFFYDTNVEKAKELLAKAGFPGGKGLPPITMTMRSVTKPSQDAFEMYRSQLAKVGIVVKPKFMTFAKYLEAMDNADFQLADSGWAADYPDAENFYQLLYGPNKAPGPNNASFAHAEYDKLYDEIRKMPHSAERAEKFKKMAAILKDEVPAIFISTPIIVGMKQQWLKSFKRHVLLGLGGQYKFMNVDSKRLAKGQNVKLSN